MGSINSMIMGPARDDGVDELSRAIEGLDGLGKADGWPVQADALATPARAVRPGRGSVSSGSLLEMAMTPNPRIE